MTRIRGLRVFLLIAIVIVGYHWLGAASLGIGLVAFMLWELLTPPPRYRVFGPGQIEQAVDNRFGRFGKNYREDAPLPEAARKISRNERCPCGSGLKFKRCCGRATE